jgi:hypothetical protein
MLGRRDDALADLRIALTPAPAGWVQGRSHIEMARLALQQGDHATARREAEEALAVCVRANDPICADEARKIK